MDKNLLGMMLAMGLNQDAFKLGEFKNEHKTLEEIENLSLERKQELENEAKKHAEEKRNRRKEKKLDQIFKERGF